MAFWADFSFLQDQADFWQTDLFWHGGHHCMVVFAVLCFVFEK